MIENLHGRNYELAKAEADKVDEQIIEVLQAGHSFRVEAGAGSGKTFIRQIIRTAFRMNEQPSMKLMFKGYQGDFPDKLFCKLSRRRKCKNEQSAITLPCLPVFFAQYDLCPTWVQVRINFCSNWAEVEFGTSDQFGWRCTGFLFPTWE